MRLSPAPKPAQVVAMGEEKQSDHGEPEPQARPAVAHEQEQNRQRRPGGQRRERNDSRDPSHDGE